MNQKKKQSIAPVVAKVVDPRDVPGYLEPIVDVHFASSRAWTRDGLWPQSVGCARLCKVAIDSNKGIMQCVIEGHTDMLDMLTNEELEEVDPDSGLNAPFLAIFYDRPKIVKYLHDRGLDLSKCCDGMGFGTCMFYAITYLRYEIVELMERLEYDILGPCTEFGETPLDRAEKVGNKELYEHVKFLAARRIRVRLLMITNAFRFLHRRRYQRLYTALKVVQRIIRGFIGRSRSKNRKRELKEAEKGTSNITRRKRNVIE